MNYDPVTQDQIIIDKKHLPSMRSVVFTSADCKLLGSIYLAGSKARVPTVVLPHGFPGNEHNQDLAHSIRRAGFNVFLFHYRGTWGSEGNFSFTNAIEDTLAAYNFIQAEQTCDQYELDSENIVFVGHSMGGFTTVINAANMPKVKNVGFLAGFNFGVLADILKLPFAEKKVLEHLANSAKMVNGTDAETLLEEVVKNKRKFNLLNYIESLREINLLIIGAKYDSTSMLSLHHKPLIKALKKHNSVKHFILESGHVFSTKRIELSHVVVEWLREIEF